MRKDKDSPTITDDFLLWYSYLTTRGRTIGSFIAILPNNSSDIDHIQGLDHFDRLINFTALGLSGQMLDLLLNIEMYWNVNSRMRWDFMMYFFLQQYQINGPHEVWISINISLEFIPKGQINNIPSLVQIMAWRLPGDKPLSERRMVSLPTHICVTRPQVFISYFFSSH